jgi:hypothetical protein
MRPFKTKEQKNLYLLLFVEGKKRLKNTSHNQNVGKEKATIFIKRKKLEKTYKLQLTTFEF